MSFSVRINSEKTYGITTTLDFGKYKGYSIGNIAQIDPWYLLWAEKNIMSFKMTQATKDMVQETASESEELSYWDLFEISDFGDK